MIYIEELIGKDIANTVPPATLSAFLDHGVARPDKLDEDLARSCQAMASLVALGISMRTVTAELEPEGIKSFASAWKALIDAVEAKRIAAIGEV